MESWSLLSSIFAWECRTGKLTRKKIKIPSIDYKRAFCTFDWQMTNSATSCSKHFYDWLYLKIIIQASSICYKTFKGPFGRFFGVVGSYLRPFLSNFALDFCEIIPVQVLLTSKWGPLLVNLKLFGRLSRVQFLANFPQTLQKSNILKIGKRIIKCLTDLYQRILCWPP